MKGWTSARPFCSVADGKRASLLHIWIANVLWVFVQNPVYRKSLPSMFYDPQHFRQTRMLAIIQSLRANVFNSFPKFWFRRSRLSPEFPQIIHFIFWTEKKCQLNNSVSVHFNSGVSNWSILRCGVICWYSKCVPSKYPHSPGFLINQTPVWFRKPMPYHWSAWKCCRYQLDLVSLVMTAGVPWF